MELRADVSFRRHRDSEVEIDVVDEEDTPKMTGTVICSQHHEVGEVRNEVVIIEEMRMWNVGIEVPLSHREGHRWQWTVATEMARKHGAARSLLSGP